jgi:hypothetical protein
MGERAKTYSPRLTEAFTGGEDVPSLYKAGKDYTATIKNVGEQAYDTMRGAGLNTSPEMQALIDKSPNIQKLIPQIEEAITGNAGTPNEVDVMHKIKEALTQQVEKAVNNPAYVDKGGISTLANNFRGAFHEANPAAEMADRAYAHAQSLPEHMELGRRFMQEGTTPGGVDASAESVADLLANASPHQAGAYTLGVQNAGRSAATNNPTNLARNLTPEKPASCRSSRKPSARREHSAYSMLPTPCGRSPTPATGSQAAPRASRKRPAGAAVAPAWGSVPDAPEFDGIRADLARLFMEHRLELGLAFASDEWIIEHTNDLTASLWFLSQHAIDHGDEPWLRHHWWLTAATRLNHGEATTTLDG